MALTASPQFPYTYDSGDLVLDLTSLNGSVGKIRAIPLEGDENASTTIAVSQVRPYLDESGVAQEDVEEIVAAATPNQDGYTLWTQGSNGQLLVSAGAFLRFTFASGTNGDNWIISVDVLKGR